VPLQHVSFDQTAPGKPESSRTKKRLHDFNPAAPEKRTVDPNRYAVLVLPMAHSGLQILHNHAISLLIFLSAFHYAYIRTELST